MNIPARVLTPHQHALQQVRAVFLRDQCFTQEYMACYVAGQDAYHAQQSTQTNPHPDGSDARAFWLAGWHDASRDEFGS
jgi:ribosome modulation factor